MDMLYHNDSSQDLLWPDYCPKFYIANADGNITYWMWGNYYRKEDGWASGIEGEPPPIPAGMPSFGWVWYGVAEQPGQYCRYVVVEWQGWQYGAEYDPQGKRIDTWAEQQ